jgi:ubiquinol-cytochrome c reductase cytochrome c1 subunit
VFLMLSLLTAPAFGSSEAVPFPWKPDTGNEQSLQRGARNFMNYCAGCHSLKYLRYNRLGRDLGIPDDLLARNLMFTTDKAGEEIRTAMPAESEKWFGRVPPDLTLTTRERGPDWVFSYLMTFYLDPTKPAGVNNLMLPGVAMPHVLGDLQGWQVRVEATGAHEVHGPQFEIVQPGRLTPTEYKAFVSDLVNFMVYAAEPGRNQRMALGGGVLLFIVIFGILSYLLKREYWKDVH